MGGFIGSAIASVVSRVIKPPPTPVAAPVAAPKPVVQPNEAVGVGQADKSERERKASIRRGAVRRRVPKSVLGSTPTTTKTLLGE